MLLALQLLLLLILGNDADADCCLLIACCRPKNPPVNKISCHALSGAPLKPQTLEAWEMESKRLTSTQQVPYLFVYLFIEGLLPSQPHRVTGTNTLQ